MKKDSTAIRRYEAQQRKSFKSILEASGIVLDTEKQDEVFNALDTAGTFKKPPRSRGRPVRKAYLGKYGNRAIAQWIDMQVMPGYKIPKGVSKEALKAMTIEEFDKYEIKGLSKGEAFSAAAKKFRITEGQAKTSYYAAEKFESKYAQEIFIGVPEVEIPAVLKIEADSRWRKKEKRSSRHGQ